MFRASEGSIRDLLDSESHYLRSWVVAFEFEPGPSAYQPTLLPKTVVFLLPVDLNQTSSLLQFAHPGRHLRTHSTVWWADSFSSLGDWISECMTVSVTGYFYLKAGWLNGWLGWRMILSLLASLLACFFGRLVTWHVCCLTAYIILQSVLRISPDVILCGWLG